MKLELKNVEFDLELKCERYETVENKDKPSLQKNIQNEYEDMDTESHDGIAVGKENGNEEETESETDSEDEIDKIYQII